MKTRTTLILLMLVVGLGLWIKFFESKQPNTAEARREAGNVVNFDREKLEGITIQNGDDRIDSVDRSVDIVSCGEGLDSVTADSRDIVGRGCEQVEVS